MNVVWTVAALVGWSTNIVKMRSVNGAMRQFLELDGFIIARSLSPVRNQIKGEIAFNFRVHIELSPMTLWYMFETWVRIDRGPKSLSGRLGRLCLAVLHTQTPVLSSWRVFLSPETGYSLG